MEEYGMETRDRLEREINIMDLFWDLLFGWRQILCFGIIFAILVCGLNYMKQNYWGNQNLTIEERERELNNEQMEPIKKARNLQKMIDEFQDYIDTAAVMQIDPYKKHMIELQYYIETDYIINYSKDNMPDYTGTVMSMYYNYIKSGEVSKEIIETEGLSIGQAEFGDLISVNQSGYAIYINIAYPDSEKLKDISKVLQNLLVQKEAEFQIIGSHRLKFMGESTDIMVDETLIEKRSTYLNRISSLETQIETLKKYMTKEQLDLLEEDKKLRYNDKMETSNFSIKYAILGLFVGVFLAAMWIICKVIFDVTLKKSEEISSLYGIRLLGEIQVQEENNKKKRFLSMVDDKLLAIKNRRKRKLSMEQQLKFSCTNIVISCKKQNIDSIYITGSEFETMDVSIINTLKQQLKKQNIQVKEGGNMFYDESSLKQGIEIGNILFVEQKEKSIYDEIFNEIQLIQEQKGNILGAIVLI